MNWNQGYYTGEGYTYGVYDELFPERLALTALLNGHTPPDLRQPFHYLDLGCGQGVNLCVMAANHPYAHFFGVDFLPAHIAHARTLAKAAGLSNVHFEEADFLALATSPPVDWPAFDMVAAHGILSWISPSLREALFTLASQVLRPGGLFYVSHNTLPGWLDRVPLQHLAAGFLQRGAPGPEAFRQAVELCTALGDADANLFKGHPSLTDALQQLAGKDPAYLCQEYLNAHWEPLFVDRVMRMAKAVKLEWIGSTTLLDRLEAMWPEPFRKLIKAQPDSELQELVRDLLLNQSFRRDVYAKGVQPLWGPAQQQLIDDIRLMLISPESLQDPSYFSLQLGITTYAAPEQRYRPLLERIADQPLSLQELAQALPDQPVQQLRSQLVLLLAARRIAQVPFPQVECQPAQHFNRHVAEAVSGGAPYRHMALPLQGNSLPLLEVDMLALDGLAKGIQSTALQQHVEHQLRDLRRQPDQPATAKAISLLLSRKLPILKRFGGWP